MKKWLRPISAAVKMGLIWAAGWAIVGFAIEFVHNVWPNSLGAMVDIWPAALAGPAFISGVLFSGLLGIAARRRRFAELSLPGFAALGGVAGALVPLAPAIMVATGMASIHGPYTLWQVVGPMMAPCALLGAVSAAGSLALARRAERGDLPADREWQMEAELGEADGSSMPMSEHAALLREAGPFVEDTKPPRAVSVVGRTLSGKVEGA